MKKRKVKKQVWMILIIIILVVIALIVGVKYIQYQNSLPYKLKEIGYTKEEIKTIETLDKKQIDTILKKDYMSSFTKFLNEKYFIFENLDRYLAYQEKHKKDALSHIISIVNVGADQEFYTNTKKTDVSKDNLMLVNKYNQLGKDYKPDDLVSVSIQYAYGTNEIRKEVYDKFRSMFNAAKKEDLTLIITSSVRDYDYQDTLWNSYSNQKGEEWADSVAARPGFSEHQTGLSLDIVTYNAGMSNFENTKEFAWLQEHAHEYGFIMRYPKDKEDITGYSYESWHYRYVGEEVAKKIKDLGITFDEYYAYYIAQ